MEHPNVLLLRTLSKGYAFAGLRLAYGIGGTGPIAPMIEKTKVRITPPRSRNILASPRFLIEVTRASVGIMSDERVVGFGTILGCSDLM